MHKILLFLAAILFIATTSVFADSVPVKKTDNILFQKVFSQVTYSGYLDTSYNYLVRSNDFTSGIYNRLYDLQQNGFTLQQASVTVASEPQQGFGWLISPVIGRDANSLAPYGWDPYFGSQTVGFTIPEVYLEYSMGPFNAIAGGYSPLAGYEYYNSIQDTNFSRSILAYTEPGEFLGVRGSYQVTSKWKMYAGISNGWDIIRDTSRGKTIEIGSEYIFNPVYSLALSGVTGMERMDSGIFTGPVGRRNLMDAVATMKATERLTFVINADYAMQTKAALPDGNLSRVTWEGIAAYVNYQLLEQWKTSLRGEIFYDQNGFATGVRQNWRELTWTLAYTPVNHMELRLETRHDISNVNSFVNTSGTGVSNNQQSFALEGLYYF